MSTRRTALLATLALACCALPAAVAAAPASAAGGWWSIRASIAPSRPQPGQPVILQAIVSNAGFKTITGTTGNPIVLRYTIPQGFEETQEVSANAGPVTGSRPLGRSPKELKCTVAAGVLTCPYVGVLGAGETVRIRWRGKLSPSTPLGAGELGVEMSGGDAERTASFTQHFTVTSAEETKFGPQRYEIIPENAKGEPEVAGGLAPVPADLDLRSQPERDRSDAGHEIRPLPLLGLPRQGPPLHASRRADRQGHGHPAVLGRRFRDRDHRPGQPLS